MTESSDPQQPLVTEEGRCAWCDLPILGTHIATGGYLWHLDCREQATS